MWWRRGEESRCMATRRRCGRKREGRVEWAAVVGLSSVGETGDGGERAASGLVEEKKENMGLAAAVGGLFSVGGKGDGGEEGRGAAAGPESQRHHNRVRRGRRGEEEGRGLGGGEGQHQYLQQEQVASQVCAGRGEEGRGKLL